MLNYIEASEWERVLDMACHGRGSPPKLTVCTNSPDSSFAREKGEWANAKDSFEAPFLDKRRLHRHHTGHHLLDMACSDHSSTNMIGGTPPSSPDSSSARRYLHVGFKEVAPFDEDSFEPHILGEHRQHRHRHHRERHHHNNKNKNRQRDHREHGHHSEVHFRVPGHFESHRITKDQDPLYHLSPPSTKIDFDFCSEARHQAKSRSPDMNLTIGKLKMPKKPVSETDRSQSESQWYEDDELDLNYSSLKRLETPKPTLLTNDRYGKSHSERQWFEDDESPSDQSPFSPKRKKFTKPTSRETCHYRKLESERKWYEDDESPSDMHLFSPKGLMCGMNGNEMPTTPEFSARPFLGKRGELSRSNSLHSLSSQEKRQKRSYLKINESERLDYHSTKRRPGLSSLSKHSRREEKLAKHSTLSTRSVSLPDLRSLSMHTWQGKTLANPTTLSTSSLLFLGLSSRSNGAMTPSRPTTHKVSRREWFERSDSMKGMAVPSKPDHSMQMVFFDTICEESNLEGKIDQSQTI